LRKISISSDHAGFELKESIKNFLIKKKFLVLDLGPRDDRSVDYPDYAKKLAKNIISKKSDTGILVCGSGTGMAMSANKFKKIRAAVCYNAKSTKLSRSHNNANIIAIGSRSAFLIFMFDNFCNFFCTIPYYFFNVRSFCEIHISQSK